MKIILFAALLFLTSCNTYPYEWEVAIEACRENGGINYYMAGPHSYGVVHCNNGAKFNPAALGEIGEKLKRVKQ